MYADWVASSRPITFIEDYVREEVMPTYANTHTTSSAFGHQTSLFREEARMIISRTINARDDKDALIFTGTGSTGAINHLVRAMRLQKSSKECCEISKKFTKDSPVVLVGPQQHHSNILPWRESICEVVDIPENTLTGLIDLEALETQLKRFCGGENGENAERRPLVIGTFSAASNITGIIQDYASVNRLLHLYGALAFWDFAAAAPYAKIDMNPIAANEKDRPLVHCDAIFISPHKFIGGVSTPGILVAKKFLFDKKLPPCSPGGGTVEFVTTDDQVYLSKISHREESGTPDIVGSIRAGLIFQLKHNVTAELIDHIERGMYKTAIERLSKNPRIHLMGPLTREMSLSSPPSAASRLVHRLPTLSFIIYHQSGKMLHYNFVCTLLDNLFGIQTRGGCVCAGPYGAHLLSMDLDLTRLYEEQLVRFTDVEVLRPGFVRLSLNYFVSPEEVDYLLNAIDFVAREGWKLLPEYTFQPETNEWLHLSTKSLSGRKWLGEIAYASGKMVYPKSDKQTQRTTSDLPMQFQEAVKTVKTSEQQMILDHAIEELSQEHELMREDAEELRWFVYPNEAYLKKIDIDEDVDLQQLQKCIDDNVPYDGNNFHSEAWRNRWLDFCPVAPRYYHFVPSALQYDVPEVTSANDSAAGDATSAASLVMPKTHRFTATVTDLDSALNAKSEFTAKQMDLEKEQKKNKSTAQEADEKVSTQNASQPTFVVPVIPAPNANKSGELDEAQERRLEDAVFEEEGEALSAHIHATAEEDDEDGTAQADFCCPLPNSASCGVGGDAARKSVKTMIDKRKADKREKKAAKAAQSAVSASSSTVEDAKERDKRQSAEATAARKTQRLERFDPVEQLEHRIFKQMVAAIRLFDLIGPGDRVLVGVSGGKDSLTLLQMLLRAQKILPFKFEVAAVTVDPQTLEFDPSPLKVYMAEIGVKYFYDSQPLISIANDIGPSSICAWCSRMKRGILHNVCEREGYNVLALGQHLDDLVESFFMYSFHNGKLDTMKAASVVRNGKVKIVRPFVFVREKDTKHYANLANLPVITENCPACFEEPKERARIKALLKAQERLYPNLFGNLLGAIKPLMHPDLHLDEALAKIDKETKADKNKKYYPKRRSDEEQERFREARAKAKQIAKDAKLQLPEEDNVKEEPQASSSAAEEEVAKPKSAATPAHASTSNTKTAPQTNGAASHENGIAKPNGTTQAKTPEQTKVSPSSSTDAEDPAVVASAASSTKSKSLAFWQAKQKVDPK